MNRREFATAMISAAGSAIALPASAAAHPSTKSRTSPEGDNLELLIEREVTPGWYPSGFFCDGGVIICSVGIGDSHLTLYSLDAGESWSVNEAVDLGSGHYKQLPDGSILGLMSLNVIEKKVRRTQPFKPFIAHQRRAKGPLEMLKGNYVDEFVQVTIPELAPNFGDGGQYYLGFIDHGIVQMDNGDLLMTMYGKFRGDDIPVPYFRGGTKQSRSWVCLSKDHGKSWNYLSTIASPEKWKLPALAEGYCEPDLLRLDGERLLAVMRSGGNPTPQGTFERYTPLFRAISRNGGATWEKPQPIYKYGVWPQLVKTKNGAVVCASGRPGVFLLLSWDNGQTWSKPEIVTNHHARYGKEPSGYNALGEVAPNVLCLLYDDMVKDKLGETHHVVKMRKYRVRR